MSSIPVTAEFVVTGIYISRKLASTTNRSTRYTDDDILNPLKSKGIALNVA
ncbi:MAG: hypothetical protein IPH85_00045 [Ignavibacteria bacterium]|nr:hypothetical protein [Ignavibacteria bacterium]